MQRVPHQEKGRKNDCFQVIQYFGDLDQSNLRHSCIIYEVISAVIPLSTLNIATALVSIAVIIYFLHLSEQNQSDNQCAERPAISKIVFWFVP